MSGFGLVQGAVITTGCAAATSCTLEELANGGTITVDRLLFSNFIITDAVRDPGDPPQAAQIVVEGLEDGGADPGPGLRYSFADQLTLASGGVQNMTFRFNFTVEEVLGAASISGHTLELVDFINAGNPGAVEGQLNIRDEVETLAATILGTALVESVRSDSNMIDILNDSDTISFAPQSALLVRTTVNGATLDQLTLETLDQRFSVLVPEPGTAPLLMLSLAALTLGRRVSGRR
jgi:hypothetical protein